MCVVCVDVNVHVCEKEEEKEGDGKANSVISAQMAIGRQRGRRTPCALSAEDDNNNKRLRSASNWSGSYRE